MIAAFYIFFPSDIAGQSSVNGLFQMFLLWLFVVSVMNFEKLGRFFPCFFSK